ncbi:MAG: hypothetical protein PVI87_01285 [Gammaproteobacteria bacterium]|jgi:hypothetical protein
MHPLTVVTGILLGSAASIAVGLLVVLFMFFLLSEEHPQVTGEMGSLVTNAGLFLAMTIVCAASFIGLVKQRRWWWLPQLVMWGGLGLLVLYYLPS